MAKVTSISPGLHWPRFYNVLLNTVRIEFLLVLHTFAFQRPCKLGTRNVNSLKKQTNFKEKELISDIEIMESNGNFQYINANLLMDKKSELQKLREKKVRGEAIRSHVQWLIEGN